MPSLTGHTQKIKLWRRKFRHDIQSGFALWAFEQPAPKQISQSDMSDRWEVLGAVCNWSVDWHMEDKSQNNDANVLASSCVLVDT